MEYYRRCNVCGDISCYTDRDLKNNLNNSLVSGMAALGSVTNAFAGTKYDMYEMSKMSNNASSKVVDYQKCTRCGSIDTFLVTKKFAQFASKRQNAVEEETLIEEAKKYLANSDFENAFCFANVACHENEDNFNGYLIKFLASFNIKAIDEINTINYDYSDNQHYINLYNHANKQIRIQLHNLCTNNKKKILITKAKKILSSNMDEIKIEEIKRIRDLLQENDLSKEEEYIKLNNYITKREQNSAKRKSKTIAILAILFLTIIAFIITNSSIKQKENYKSIMSLLENRDYYNAMTNYYEKLNITNKEKVNKYLINEISKHRWASDNVTDYKGENDTSCLSKEYISFTDNSMFKSIKCPDDNKELEQEWQSKQTISLTLNEDKLSIAGVYKLKLTIGSPYYLNLAYNNYYITYESYYSNTGREFINKYSITKE